MAGIKGKTVTHLGWLEKATIIQKRLDGETVPAIANEMGRSTTTVENVLKAAGIRKPE